MTTHRRSARDGYEHIVRGNFPSERHKHNCPESRRQTETLLLHETKTHNAPAGSTSRRRETLSTFHTALRVR